MRDITEDILSLIDDCHQPEPQVTVIGDLNDGIKNSFTLIFTQEGEETPRQVATFAGTLERFSVKTLNIKEFLIKSSAVYSCNYFIMPVLKEEIGDVFSLANKMNILSVY